MPRRVELRYRASEPLAEADVIWVEQTTGHRDARILRDRTTDGRVLWRWAGVGVPDFSIEEEAGLSSFLITDPLGAPFGRARRRGMWRSWLEVSDARGVQLTVDAHGRLCAPQGRLVGWVTIFDACTARLLAEPIEDPTLRSLVLTTPLCHALQSTLLFV